MRAVTNDNCRGGSPSDTANQANSTAGLCADRVNAVDLTEWETRREGDAESEMKMVEKGNLLIL
jgi:hypothetical protein